MKALCKENKKFTGIVIRFFNTFGPYQTAQFAIPKFINLVKNNASPIINGTGGAILVYCYVSDSAQGTVNALKKAKYNNNFSIYNIGNPNNSISVLELSRKIINLSKKNIKPKINRDFSQTDRIKEREVFARLCDISKAKSELKFSPKINLISGLKKPIIHKSFGKTGQNIIKYNAKDECSWFNFGKKRSKGLKNKNLKDINGFSLIELAILAGLESKVITEIVFSTDYKKSDVGQSC